MRTPALILTILLLLIPSQSTRHARDIGPLPDTGETMVPQGLLRYEPLLRHYAGQIQWDWRLLGAIVYQESRFNEQALSSQGAVGLMQILSPRYSRDTLLNPSLNLEIGTAYLQKLEQLFEAATPLDSLSFALASFNWGDGNVRKLRREAAAQGLDYTRWKETARLLPEGHHTVAYVKNVLATYGCFRQALDVPSDTIPTN